MNKVRGGGVEKICAQGAHTWDGRDGEQANRDDCFDLPRRGYGEGGCSTCRVTVHPPSSDSEAASAKRDVNEKAGFVAVPGSSLSPPLPRLRDASLPTPAAPASHRRRCPTRRA